MLYEVLHLSPCGESPDLADAMRSEGVGVHSVPEIAGYLVGGQHRIPLGILIDRHSTIGGQEFLSEAIPEGWQHLLGSAGRTILLNGLSPDRSDGIFRHFHWLPAGNQLALRNSIQILMRDYMIQRMRRLAGATDPATLEALEERISSLTDGVFCVSPGGRILFANQRARMLAARRDQKFVGTSVYLPTQEYLNQDGAVLSRERHPWRSAMRTGEPVSDVVIGIKGESGIQRYAVSTFPVREPTSRRVRFVIEAFVPELEGAHAIVELERTKERLEKLLATIPSIIYVVEVSGGECRFENDQMTLMLGYSAEDVAAGGPDFLIQIMHPEDREPYVRARASLSGDSPPASIDRIVRVHSSRGRVRWLHLHETAFEVAPSGGPMRLLGSGVDITDAMESSRIIGEQNLMFSGIFHHSPVMLLLRDNLGAVLAVNREFERATGFSSIEVIGKSPAEFLPFDERAVALKAFEQIIRGERYEPFETAVRTKEGTQRHLRVSSVIIRNLEGESQFIVTALEDLTEYRHLQQQLAEARKMEALGSMAGGVAHDFNNILQGISNFQQLILMELDRLGSKVDPAVLQRLQTSLSNQRKMIERGADITGQILEFSRTKEMNAVVLDLLHELNEFRQVFGPQMPGTVKQEFLLPSGPVPVLASRVSFQRLVQNLFTNAGKALVSRSVQEFRVSLEVRTLQGAPEGALLDVPPGEYARLVFYDSGCGIPADRVRRIFDPFYTDRPNDPGTGLGLAVVYAAVRRMNGTIVVRSEPEKFTEFCLYLPLYRQNETQPVQK